MAEYKSQVWRVNVRQQTLTREPVPETWQRLGGRGLLARILLDEVDAKCDPLGPGNKLIFAPGLLVGHMLSSTDRISVGGKSPLTGGIKEANAGGRTLMHYVGANLNGRMALMGFLAVSQETVNRYQTVWTKFLEEVDLPSRSRQTAAPARPSR